MDDCDPIRPWDGDKPPQHFDRTADVNVFVKKPDGVWAKRDGLGKLLQVDRYGEMWRKPKDVDATYDRRPTYIPMGEWAGKPSAERGRIWEVINEQ